MEDVSPSSTWRRAVSWGVLYLLLSVVIAAPLSLHPSDRLPDDGDSLGMLWLTWWTSTRFFSNPRALLQTNGYYPHPDGLLYSDPMLAQGLLGWPLFALFENPILAFNLLTLVTLALTALAAHMLFREHSGADAGAAVGAVYYALNSYNLSHLARLQLISLQWMPLALYCLHRLFTRRASIYAWGFAFFSLLQGLASLYYLVFYALALVFILPAYFWAYRGTARATALSLLGPGAACGAILGGLTLRYVAVHRRYGFTSEAGTFDLLGYVLPPAGSFLYPVIQTSAKHLADHFLGFIALALGAYGWVVSLRLHSGRRTVIVPLAVSLMGIAALLLSAGPEIDVNGSRIMAGPFSVLRSAGAFEKLHDPDRLSVLVTLALGWFVASGAARLLAGLNVGPRVVACGLLASLVIAEHWSPKSIPGRVIPSGRRLPEVYAWLADHPGADPVAELPLRPLTFLRFTMLDAYFSTYHERPFLFSKPSFYPPALELLYWDLRDFPDRRSIALLQALKVRLALVHPKRWGPERRRKAKQLARRPETLELVAEFPDRDDPLWDRYGLGGERLYSLPPLSKEGSPRVCDCREIDRRSYRTGANGLNDPYLAVDGERATKWTTGAVQAQGDSFEITFDRPRRPARIEIEMAFPYGEFARHLEIEGLRDAAVSSLTREADIWYELKLIRQLIEDPSKARLRYDLEPVMVDRLRLFIGRTEEGALAWSIPEIHVYESANGHEKPTP